jgi:ABC-2 type transport system permease protein
MLALIWREFKVGTTAYLLFTYFITPTIYLVIFALAISTSISPTIAYSGLYVNYISFIAAGIIGIQTLSMFNQSFAITRLDVVTNFLTVLMTSNTKLYKYVLARIVTIFSVLSAQFIYVVSLTYILSGYIPSTFGICLALIFMFIGLLFWFSLGTICGLYIKNELTRDIVMLLVSTPATFLSSSLYNLNQAPQVIKMLGYFNPLTYTVDLIRSSYFGLPIEPVELLVLIVITLLALFLLGLSIHRFTIK